MDAPVSILRPLHGAEPGLTEALASSLRQDYAGQIQLVCGIQGDDDLARAAVERLRRKFPEHDIVLAIDLQRKSGNPKIANLANMLPRACHDILMTVDSDISTPPSWLASVMASLDEPQVGAVSCFYAGEGRGRWSRLTAMGINYHFLPNALFGAACRLAHPCFGSTIALRREILEQIGGVSAFRHTLADDFEIGRAVRRRGYRLAYPPRLVSHACTEQSFRELWTHELRWARTIRTIDPWGHWGSLLTHALPLGLLGAALLGATPAALGILATVVAARLFLKYRIDHIAGAPAGPAWLLSLRDVLSFAVFLASLFGSTVSWRGDRLRVSGSGAIS